MRQGTHAHTHTRTHTHTHTHTHSICGKGRTQTHMQNVPTPLEEDLLGSSNNREETKLFIPRCTKCEVYSTWCSWRVRGRCTQCEGYSRSTNKKPALWPPPESHAPVKHPITFIGLPAKIHPHSLDSPAKVSPPNSPVAPDQQHNVPHTRHLLSTSLLDPSLPSPLPFRPMMIPSEDL